MMATHIQVASLHDLLRGRLEKFSLEFLLMFAERAGVQVQVRILQPSPLAGAPPDVGSPCLSVNSPRSAAAS
jgi:hypothetical protein